MAKIMHNAYLCKEKTINISHGFNRFLILGKTQYGGEDGDHHGPPVAPLPIKYISSC